MHPIEKCDTYHAVVRDRELFRGPDGKTALKVYYVDIVGRADPARTEWDKCGLAREDFLAALARTEAAEGVGCVLAFPHITKLFRFGPARETLMNVRAWATPTMEPIDLGREEGYVEFACLAEALIAADEYRFWAEAGSVEEYLGLWSECREAPVACNDKLLAYW